MVRVLKYDFEHYNHRRTPKKKNRLNGSGALLGNHNTFSAILATFDGNDVCGPETKRPMDFVLRKINEQDFVVCGRKINAVNRSSLRANIGVSDGPKQQKTTVQNDVLQKLTHTHSDFDINSIFENKTDVRIKNNVKILDEMNIVNQ